MAVNVPAGAPTSTATRPRRRRGRFRWSQVAMFVGVLALVGFSVFPLFWMFITSVKPRAEILTPEPVLWPSTWEWGRYVTVIERGFGTALVNSLWVSLTVTFLGVLVSVLAGYAFARTQLPLKRVLLVTVLSTQMFPLVAMIIPLFIVMRNLDLLGSLWGLIVAYLAFITPLMIWILRGFFLSIPADLEDAAMVDGCSRFGAMWRVVMPLAGPGVAAVSIFAWIAAWNELLFALTFIQSDSLRTLPVGLTYFAGRESTDHGAIMAASVLFTLPIVIFFLFVHKKLTTGLVAGAVKG